MLAVSPLRNTGRDEKQGEMESCSFTISSEEFPDFADGNYLESINFDDLFVGIDVEGDVLPDLEMEHDIHLAELPGAAVNIGSEESEMNTSSIAKTDEDIDHNRWKLEEEDKFSGSGSDSGLDSSSSKLGEEIVSKREEPKTLLKTASKLDGADKGRKSSSAQPKLNNQGKRKVKVNYISN